MTFLQLLQLFFGWCDQSKVSHKFKLPSHNMQFEIAHIHCLNLKDWSHAQYWDIVSLTLSTTRSVAFSPNFSFWLKKKIPLSFLHFFRFILLFYPFQRLKKKPATLKVKMMTEKKTFVKKSSVWRAIRRETQSRRE